MCVGVCGKILEIIDSQFAYVELFGIKTKVNTLLIEDPKVNDYVLIHTGYAIEKVSQQYADSLQELLNEWLDHND